SRQVARELRKRLGLSVQARYARGVSESDPAFPATARKSILTWADRVTKNAQTTAPNVGGSLFPPGYSNETIEAIREKLLSDNYTSPSTTTTSPHR
ncbi:MAG: hypothetical protein WBV82_19080, partial [Myxococcaceae bacterium]